MAKTMPMPMCPMAGMCKGMMEKQGSSFVLLILGVVFIILGVVILIEPHILLWLVALALIVMGVAMLMIARFIRRSGAQSISG